MVEPAQLLGAEASSLRDIETGQLKDFQITELMYVEYIMSMNYQSFVCFYRIFIAVLGVVIGCLSQMEVEKEILLLEKSVALPTNRAKTFQFLSRMSNYAQV